MTERNYFFDNVKAVLITLVVFGHIIEPLRDIQIFKVMYFIIYSFHMPLFIFITGYFSKPSTKGLKKMGVLFIKYRIIYSIVYALLFGLGSAPVDPGILSKIELVLQPFWILWFLVSLISWRLLLIVFEKYPKTIIGLIAVVILFNFIPFNFRILSLGRTMTFFPFFLLGYLAKKYKFDFNRIKVHSSLLLYISGFVLAFWVLYSTNVADSMLYGATSLITEKGNLLSLTLFKINTYLVAIAASIVILNIIPQGKQVYSDIGSKTLSIFLMHPFIIGLLLSTGFYKELTSFSTIIIAIIAVLLSLFTTLLFKEWKV